MEAIYSTQFSKDERISIQILKLLMIIILLSADLDISTGIPNLSFALSIILLIVISVFRINSIHFKINISKNLLIIWTSIFIISTFILLYAKNFDNIIHAMKLLVIFMIIYPLMNIYYNSDELIMFLKICIIINFILIIMSQLGFENLARITGKNRGSTFLNYAGSLYKIPILVIPYLIWDIFKAKKNKYKNIALSLISIYLILYDGSRTGFILIILYFILFSVYLVIYCHKNNLYDVLIIFVLALIIISTVLLAFATSSFNSSNAILRIADTIHILKTNSLKEAFLKIDSIRGQMIIDGINKVKENLFFLGSGFGSTTTGGMVIHNTYLQILADLGILPLVALITMMILPLLKKAEKDCYNYVFPSKIVIFAFAIMALFHPFSAQASDWAIYFIPLLIINS